MKNQETDVFIELHVPDFQKTIDFYKILGFKVLWVNDEYLVMQRGKSIINFAFGDDRAYTQSYFKNFSKNTKRGYGVELVIFVDNIKEFYKKVKDKVKVVDPLILQRWGRWDFRIEDPFGFYLRVTERYNWLDDKNLIANSKEIIKKKGFKI